MEPKGRRVAVTGLGVVAPCGIGRDDYWRGLLGPGVTSGQSTVIADWAGYSDGHPEWTISDHLHISAAGAPVLAQFIADNVAQVLAGA